MSITAASIVHAAVDAALQELRTHGLADDIRHLPRLFEEALSSSGSFVAATLTTPTGNAGPAKDAILAALETSLGKKVLLEEKADPSLLGGAVLTYGDERIDMSLRSSLDSVAQSLKKSA